MSVLEIVGGNDRRSMIKRYERKSKQEAIRELVDIIHCNWNQVEQLEATCETLRGLQPAAPPRPPEGEGLPRYGLRWNGPSQPVSVPMDDGYWTPWHLAAATAPVQQATDGGRNLRYEGLFEGETEEQRSLRLAPVQPVSAEMVNRFLAWPLPTDVCADPCASMSGYPHHRSGTNLLTALQARAMLEHVLVDHSAHDLKMVEQPIAAPAEPSIESVLLWLNYYVSGKFNTDDRGPRNALNILCAAFAVDLPSTQAGGRA